MTKILVLNDREPLPESALDQFAGRAQIAWCQEPGLRFSLDEALRNHADAGILVTTYMDLTAENLSRLPRLEAIIATTTGVDYIDIPFCKTHGIRVCNTRNYTGSSVAEHAIALMFTVARRIVPLNDRVHAGDFDSFDLRGIELHEKCAGVIGAGSIGTTIAKLCLGLGMRVVFSNRSPKAVEGAEQVSIEHLLATSDVIFLAVPLNTGTRGLINAAALAGVKRGAILVSVVPDAVVDREALELALKDGRLGGAGLDLHGRDRLYLAIPNLILTARRAWFTSESFSRRLAAWKSVLARYLDGSPINVVA